jgi:hypothetical protein
MPYPSFNREAADDGALVSKRWVQMTVLVMLIKRSFKGSLPFPFFSFLFLLFVFI